MPFEPRSSRDSARAFKLRPLPPRSHSPSCPSGAISTGLPALDAALGIGGLARGRVVEIYGAAASGKTTLVCHIIAETQRRGGACALIDADHALEFGYAARQGVDPNELLVCRPEHGERAFQVAETLIRSSALAVVCIDSAAALPPRGELGGSLDATSRDLHVGLMSSSVPRLAALVATTETVCIFTNQLRSARASFGDWCEITTGGAALPYQAAQRLELRSVGMIMQAGKPVGSRVRATVVKNTLARPRRRAEFVIRLGAGIYSDADLHTRPPGERSAPKS